MADTFWEKYKHPKWQEKRLRIMERDGFKCVVCGENDETLNVHHGYYERDKDPWDYDDATLYTTCESCHRCIQNELTVLRATLARVVPPGRYIDIAFAFDCLSRIKGSSKEQQADLLYRVLLELSYISGDRDAFSPLMDRVSNSLEMDTDITFGIGASV